MPHTGDVDNIPVHLCTHLVYTFAGLDETTWQVKSLEPRWDIDQNGFRKLVALKSKSPSLKVSFAIGGWVESVKKYSDLASDSRRIRTFVRSVRKWIDAYNFDGVDLDWEYPADSSRGGKPRDRKNFIKLLRALRRALGSKHLLTVAVGAPDFRVNESYKVRRIARLVDFIHVMTYDMRSARDKIVANHVSLYPSSGDEAAFRKLTVVSVFFFVFPETASLSVLKN